MRYCKNCNDKIPQSVVINGKQKKLERRAFCLKCNPYGNKFTGPARKNGESKTISYFGDDGNRLVKCDSCGKEHKTKTRNYKCSSCRSKHNRKKQKQKAVDYLGGKCEKCGYNKCLDSLCFHHKDPTKKEFTVSMFWLRSWKKIEEEIKKCQLLCANCHSEVHANLWVRGETGRDASDLKSDT